VLNFLRNTSIWEWNHRIVTDNLRNEQFLNPLKPVGQRAMMGALSDQLQGQLGFSQTAQG